jgi:hypothetical protein
MSHFDEKDSYDAEYSSTVIEWLTVLAIVVGMICGAILVVISEV